MQRFRIQRLLAAPAMAIGLCAVLWPADGNAAMQARIDLGAELAKTWCANCHAVDPSKPITVQTDVPTFESIANRDGITEDKLKNFLQNPHPPMPNLDLTRVEIENVVEYILSLKHQ